MVFNRSNPAKETFSVNVTDESHPSSSSSNLLLSMETLSKLVIYCVLSSICFFNASLSLRKALKIEEPSCSAEIAPSRVKSLD
ncbi:hypothetical protein SDC9_164931 [bioreactor metagenome]|uniref:Uncharacterized protein n=1 Tax=bioreactor metagenome TaxID=1076179 RepID=A0A645FUV4_9ZZZZ